MSSRLRLILAVISLSLTSLLFIYLFVRPASKIAYVDSSKLINGYQGMIEFGLNVSLCVKSKFLSRQLGFWKVIRCNRI